MSVSKQTALYLKQFFRNYIIQQEHTNNINLMISSLEVLEDSILSFSQKNNIFINSSTQVRSLFLKQANFNQIFERLFLQLNQIFQWMQQKLKLIIRKDDVYDSFDQQIFEDEKKRNNRKRNQTNSFDISMNMGNDQELYQILNQYKLNNKKLKEDLGGVIKKLQSKSGELLEMKIGKQQTDKQLSYLQSRIEELEQQLENASYELREQRKQKESLRKNYQQIQNKYNLQRIQLEKSKKEEENRSRELRESKVLISKLEKQIRQMTDKHQRAKQQYKLNIETRVKQLPSIINSIVEKKMNQPNIWQQSFTNAIKKYAKYINSNKGQFVNKENIFDNANSQKKAYISNQANC